MRLRKVVLSSIALLLLLVQVSESQVPTHVGGPFPARRSHGSPPGSPPPLPVLDPLWNGLVGYWRMDETSGNRADALGVYTLTDVSSVGYVSGKNSNAANFTTTNYLTSGDFSPTLGQTTAGVTWAFWMKRTSNPGSLACVLASSLSSNPPWQIRFDSSGRCNPFIRDSASNVITVTSSLPSLCNDTWHLVVVTWNRPDIPRMLLVTIPETGVTNSSALGSYDLMLNSAAGMWAGRDAAGSYLYAVGSPATAAVDEVAIWNRALSVAEVERLYNAGAGRFYPN